MTNMEKKITVFIVDDDEFSLENISLSLSSDKYEITQTGSSEEALSLLQKNDYDIAILDLKLQGMSGLDIIEKVKGNNKLTKYLLITGYSEEEAFIKATRIGVNDILKKPYEEFKLHSTLEKLLHLKKLEEENLAYKEKLQKENEILKDQLDKSFEDGQNSMIGNSPLFKSALDKAESVAKYSLNTLICGETGTGKELLARFIQRKGTRKNEAFVPVNCAALSEPLFESELFGYEKGAFTNALQSHAGLFEVANGGIIFLDEITEIPISLQAKLLRVLEDKKIKRVGSTKEIEIDVQILCSSNRDTSEAISEGFLREDLYHRIAQTEIVLPPLRERMDDLDLLSTHFYSLYCRMFDKENKGIPEEITEYIKNQSWEGNIRQFSNFMKNYSIFGTITRYNVPQTKPTNRVAEAPKVDTKIEGNSFEFENGSFNELEIAKQWLIEKALNKFNGNKTLAAKHLGVSYQGLAYLLKNNN
ncbi:MAG: sigma-54 dependent transcriptional regulator [Melioribacteraceae bacterium]|nr:sigma-54 dependent transcriptional regulator [Melioribacteraceae bacterium]